jgi:hypothetical protein
MAAPFKSVPATKAACGDAVGRATPLVPPYWQHQRVASQASIISNSRPAAILLEDNTEVLGGLKSSLWARLITIDSHTVVSGNIKGLGDYVVWNCRVQTLEVSFTHKKGAL